nr:Chain E, 50S ribosomal protein L12 [Pyrococcus horikoshii OT3]5H7L_G Chain G, 50S ribosomal protein L12 [Pyrococcus horikoshii OT3]
EALAGLSALFG